MGYWPTLYPNLSSDFMLVSLSDLRPRQRFRRPRGDFGVSSDATLFLVQRHRRAFPKINYFQALQWFRVDYLLNKDILWGPYRQIWPTSNGGTERLCRQRWCTRQLLASTINSLDITQLTAAAAAATAGSESEFVPGVIFRYANVTTCQRSTPTGTQRASSAVSVRCHSTLNRPATSESRASTANKTISGQSMMSTPQRTVIRCCILPTARPSVPCLLLICP